MTYCGVIPARFKSSRFPGKSIADILGKPMIWHVYQAASKFEEWSQLIVATDDERVLDVCSHHDIPAFMTSTEHKDCIDRAAEVMYINQQRGQHFDRYIVIQGDEPMFDTSTLAVDLSPEIVNFYTKVSDPDELDDPNAVKVVVSKNLRAIYFSRYSIPYHKPDTMKSGDTVNIDKQLGLYSFSEAKLEQFQKLGMSYLEGVEGVGLLRLLENDIEVHMRYADYDSFSVDTIEDLHRVERMLINRPN